MCSSASAFGSQPGNATASQTAWNDSVLANKPRCQQLHLLSPKGAEQPLSACFKAAFQPLRLHFLLMASLGYAQRAGALRCHGTTGTFTGFADRMGAHESLILLQWQLGPGCTTHCAWNNIKYLGVWTESGPRPPATVMEDKMFMFGVFIWSWIPLT